MRGRSPLGTVLEEELDCLAGEDQVTDRRWQDERENLAQGGAEAEPELVPAAGRAQAGEVGEATLMIDVATTANGNWKRRKRTCRR